MSKSVKMVKFRNTCEFLSSVKKCDFFIFTNIAFLHFFRNLCHTVVVLSGQI